MREQRVVVFQPGTTEPGINRVLAEGWFVHTVTSYPPGPTLVVFERDTEMNGPVPVAVVQDEVQDDDPDSWIVQCRASAGHNVYYTGGPDGGGGWDPSNRIDTDLIPRFTLQVAESIAARHRTAGWCLEAAQNVIAIHAPRSTSLG